MILIIYVYAVDFYVAKGIIVRFYINIEYIHSVSVFMFALNKSNTYECSKEQEREI